MGMAITGRLNGISINPPGATTWAGATGGAATAIMTAEQMAAHSHSLAAAGTGITIAGAATGITIATGYAYIAGAYTGIATAGAYTGIGIHANYTGVLSPTPATATPCRRGRLAGCITGGGGGFAYADVGTTHVASGTYISDPTHAHSVSDPTMASYQ